MRRLLAIILAATMLFLLCSCKAQPVTQTPETTQPAQTTSPTVSNNNIEYEQKPMYAVSLVPQIAETTDDSGKTRFRYAYQNISLVLPEPEVAVKIILDYLSRMDQADQYAASVRTNSLDEVYDTLPYLPLFYHITYAPARFDANLLSFHVNEIIYLGGVHPDHIGHSVTYDLLTGEVLKLSDVLNDDISAKEIADTVIANLSDTDGFWQDYKDIVKEMFHAGLEKYEYWYFTEDGLCFYFDPYVLAPFAAGPITVTLPYSELVGTLRDEYFPAEQDSYQGDLVVEKFTVDAQKDFTQFAEVVLVEDGTKILLSADGAITDISIQVILNTYGVSNVDGDTVMAVQSLTPGDAIMVEFDSSSTWLLVSYRNGDQYETKKIIHNQDGISIF